MKTIETKTVKMRAFGTHFFGRKQGNEFYERLSALLLRSVPLNGVLQIDISGIAVIDYTFADSCFVQLLVSLATHEYGTRFVAFKAVQECGANDRLTNIDVALEARQLCANLWHGETRSLLGALAPHLRETLDALDFDRLTAQEVAVRLKLSNTATARLNVLRDLRLVRVETEPFINGLQYFYSRVI